MIVECINNDQAKAPDVFVNGGVHPTHVHVDLSVGQRYFVYGMSVYNDNLFYLVRTDLGDSRWKLPYFFEVRDDRIPPYWEFRYSVIEGQNRMGRPARSATWGYRALLEDPAHVHGFIEEADFSDEIARRAELGF
jgi:hypothetical protein